MISTMSWRVVKQLMVIGTILTLPLTAYAQEAVVSGTVTDSTGGVLPGVTVTALHEATGNTFLAVTDERGNFRLPVRTGNFRITVELSGFGTINRTVELLLGQNAVLNLQVAPSTVQESVTVTGEAPLIDRTNSSLAGNIDPRQMQELPVNGRNWMDLTMLAPGSRQNAVNETPVPEQRTTVQFQLNLDGQQVTNMVAVGFGQPRYSRDAIAEFEFVSNRFDASQGRSSGVQVNAITKSGTNRPSGSFSGYFRDDKFNAADHIAGRVLPYSDQQLSGTFGGPIVRDKFHYFGGYEFEHEPQTYLYTTPYPAFNGSLTGAREERKGVLRFDFQFSSQRRLSVRGTRYDNEIPYDSRFTGGSDRTISSAIGVNRRSEQILATFTQVLGTRALNEVKVGHDGFHWNQYAHVRNPNSLPGMTPGFGAPQITFRGFTVGQSHFITPQDIGDDLYMFRDDFSLSFSKGGRHDLKVGGEYIYHFTFETVCNGCMGQLDLQGGAPPANLPDFFPNIMDVSTWNLAPLSYLARTYQRPIGMEHSPYSRPAGNHGFTEYAPRHVYAGWIQDDWQIAKSLTLNLGLRYDLGIGTFVNWVAFPPFIEADRPEDTNNFGPRVGFAYSVNDRTVIRGGYGRYFADVTGQPAVFTLRNVQQITPLILNDGRPDFASNPFNGPAPTYEQAAQLRCSVNRRAGCLRPGFGLLVAPDLVFPYSHQISIGVQRQLGTMMSFEADYVFTGDRGILTVHNTNIAYNPATGANYPFVGAAADVTKRVYPDWGNTGINRPLGKGQYHALQAGFTKRMSNRWQASATYTLAGQWNFDTLPLNPGCKYPMTSTGNEPARCDVPITLARDITENDYYLAGDQRHRVTFNGIWQLPYEFQLSGLYLFGDNGKSTPSSGVDVRNIGTAVGQISAGLLRANGTLIARNSFERGAIQRVDLRVQRRLRLGGRVAVDGIFEVYNLFDRANYNAWVTNESNARYGRPQQDTNLAYAPRMLQLGFRTTF